MTPVEEVKTASWRAKGLRAFREPGETGLKGSDHPLLPLVHNYLSLYECCDNWEVRMDANWYASTRINAYLDRYKIGDDRVAKRLLGIFYRKLNQICDWEKL